LAVYRRCVQRIRLRWPEFQGRRLERLRERERFGHAAERATESILEDLFTGVLDWSIGDVNHQVGYADLLLTRLGIGYLILEAKRPGALAWNRRAVEAALEQARRYADEQRVRSLAVSDGHMLYAADVAQGGLRDRVYVPLVHDEPQEALWWLSVHGIYRPAPGGAGLLLPLERETGVDEALAGEGGESILHPKYRLPPSCFAYVGHAGDPHTWRLPYRRADGSVDPKRLPKAVQAILSNYRGARVSGIPESAIADVLVRLGRAAASLGKMPPEATQPAPVYEQLAAALKQLDRLDEIAFDQGTATLDQPETSPPWR